MSMIGTLVRDSVALVQKTKTGIHPAKTRQHIDKLETQLAKLKPAMDYIADLTDEVAGWSDEETPIRIRLRRDRRSLVQVHTHLQSCIAHLRGHNWGIFAE